MLLLPENRPKKIAVHDGIVETTSDSNWNKNNKEINSIKLIKDKHPELSISLITLKENDSKSAEADKRHNKRRTPESEDVVVIEKKVVPSVAQIKIALVENFSEINNTELPKNINSKNAVSKKMEKDWNSRKDENLQDKQRQLKNKEGISLGDKNTVPQKPNKSTEISTIILTEDNPTTTETKEIIVCDDTPEGTIANIKIVEIISKGEELQSSLMSLQKLPNIECTLIKENNLQKDTDLEIIEIPGKGNVAEVEIFEILQDEKVEMEGAKESATIETGDSLKLTKRKNFNHSSRKDVICEGIPVTKRKMRTRFNLHEEQNQLDVHDINRRIFNVTETQLIVSNPEVKLNDIMNSPVGKKITESSKKTKQISKTQSPVSGNDALLLAIGESAVKQSKPCKFYFKSAASKTDLRGEKNKKAKFIGKVKKNRKSKANKKSASQRKKRYCKCSARKKGEQCDKCQKRVNSRKGKEN